MINGKVITLQKVQIDKKDHKFLGNACKFA